MISKHVHRLSHSDKRTYNTCEFPPDRTLPPNRGLAKTVCTIFSWALSMVPLCFISSGHSGSPHSSQSSMVSHCFALMTFRDILMVLWGSSLRIPSALLVSSIWPLAGASFLASFVSSQSKYFKKLLNFIFWLSLSIEE